MQALRRTSAQVYPAKDLAPARCARPPQRGSAWCHMPPNAHVRKQSVSKVAAQRLQACERVAVPCARTSLFGTFLKMEGGVGGPRRPACPIFPLTPCSNSARGGGNIYPPATPSHALRCPALRRGCPVVPCCAFLAVPCVSLTSVALPCPMLPPYIPLPCTAVPCLADALASLCPALPCTALHSY